MFFVLVFNKQEGLFQYCTGKSMTSPVIYIIQTAMKDIELTHILSHKFLICTPPSTPQATSSSKESLYAFLKCTQDS